MKLRLVAQPAVEPVGLAEMKAHLRIDGDDEDAAVLAFIKAAREALDGRGGLLGRALVTQTWRLTVDGLRSEVALPLPPCQAILSVEHSGVMAALDPLAYVATGLGSVDGAVLGLVGGRHLSASWYGPGLVSITCRAGYGDAPGDVPEPIRQAIRMHAAHLFGARESVSGGSDYVRETPQGWTDLVDPYRLRAF